jgi:hypothetical protein
MSAKASDAHSGLMLTAEAPPHTERNGINPRENGWAREGSNLRPWD